MNAKAGGAFGPARFTVCRKDGHATLVPMKFRLDKKRKPKPPTKVGLALRPWRVQIIVGSILTVCIALILTGIWYGSRIDSLQITEVTVIGGDTIPHTAIEQVARDVLAGTYYQLVPRTFAWTYPADDITSRVMNIPRVKQVYSEVAEQTLTIVFDEYQPAALWCKESTAADCLFIDAEGFAFAAAPQLIGSAFIRYVATDTEPQLKTTGFPAAYMETTSQLAELLERELGLYVTQVLRKDEVDTSYILASGAEIKVSERMSAEETFTNLQTIFVNEEFAQLRNGEFHYIDLRFGDKVFVSESEIIATTTSATSTPE